MNRDGREKSGHDSPVDCQKSGAGIGCQSAGAISIISTTPWRTAMNFRIRGLEAAQFSHLFALSDAELAAHGAVRKIADGPNPCRVSLTDATPGEEVILVNYEHHAVASPYRMRFAIYVRKGEKTFDAVDTIPDQLRRRTLAVRGFDGNGMMAGWELIEGMRLEEAIER